MIKKFTIICYRCQDKSKCGIKILPNQDIFFECYNCGAIEKIDFEYKYPISLKEYEEKVNENAN